VDQVILCCSTGRNRHEHIMESLALFGRDVLPEFAELEERAQRRKSERLAPVIAEVSRRKPAADHPDLDPDSGLAGGSRRFSLDLPPGHGKARDPCFARREEQLGLDVVVVGRCFSQSIKSQRIGHGSGTPVVVESSMRRPGAGRVGY